VSAHAQVGMMTPAIAVGGCMQLKVRDQIERAMMAHERIVRRCGAFEFASVAHTVEQCAFLAAICN
jgi:hypothetical protein